MDRPLITWAEVTLDYCDSERAANFWSTVLDLPARSQLQPGWFQIDPASTGGPVINIQPVAESKVGKSRLHLDLWVNNLPAAVALVQSLGGRTLDEHSHDEWHICVMADPEGIEFCLVGRSARDPDPVARDSQPLADPKFSAYHFVSW
jgi:predicted enzyme related to lactoylglutathione lyase